MPSTIRVFSLTCFVVFLTLPARAGDGVLEINQSCAVNTGCFAGDQAGFPVTITGAAGRSYRLTSDLLVANRNTTAIAITQRDTSIDLGGFEIVLTTCQSLACLPIAGSGVGVSAEGVKGVSVKNGSITAMGANGAWLGDQAEVSGLRVRWNGGSGIRVGLGSNVSGCNAHENGVAGISASIGSIVSGNTAFDNIGDGIVADTGSAVSGNTSSLNALGITALGAVTVSGNTVYANSGSGISAGNGSIVSGNSVSSNGFFGLSLSSSASYRANTITSNATGTVNSGVNRGDNYCAGTGTVSALCP